MRETKSQEQNHVIVCICAGEVASALLMKKLICRRLPSTSVLIFGSLEEFRDRDIDSPFILVFSASEEGWTSDSLMWVRKDVDCFGKFAMTDSAEPEFLSELYASGVDDYFLDVPEGLVAASARIVRELVRVALVDSGAENNLAERIREVTFRETVASINHQINNPLSEILATVELLSSSEVDFDALQRSRLQEIQNSAQRIARVTDNLLELVSPESHNTAAGNMLGLPRDKGKQVQSRLKAEHFEPDGS